MLMTTHHHNAPIYWQGSHEDLADSPGAILETIHQVSRPLYVVTAKGRPTVVNGGAILSGAQAGEEPGRLPLKAIIPAFNIDAMGSTRFKRRYGIKFAYIVGAMANGITSVQMVATAAKAGFMGFFGAAGLTIDEVARAIDQIRHTVGSRPFGSNLIHSPNEPELESALVRLYLEKGVHCVSASAYLNLTLPLVYYRVKGIHRREDGAVVCPNRVIAKVSRIEVARRFLSPPPENLVAALVERNLINATEAQLSREVLMADDLTAEADSGGHTDNRPAMALLPTMMALRDEMARKHGLDHTPGIGLAGGIATPAAVAGAFAMGADWVLTGSINQACAEAGTSQTVRDMLVQARQGDVIMAPSADMFEMGVKVQVLKRGTMFPLRAQKLYDLYQQYERYEQIPATLRSTIEKDLFRQDFEAEWLATRAFFQHRDPRQIDRAENDPKYKMALVFRAYLGKASGWANSGDPSRVIDYQIWCGPAMGAFNEWAKNSFLEQGARRNIVDVAANLLFGAAVTARMNWLKAQGVDLPATVQRYVPQALDEIERCCGLTFSAEM